MRLEVTNPTEKKPRIAVFAGPTATILNSPPLVTSDVARRLNGLPLLTDRWGETLKYDVLRPQRLARPATVYVEQFSAHPLERDAADLYGPPHGYLDSSLEFHAERQSPDDKPVYEITLQPEDGLYPLPYMATRVDGSPWDGDCSDPTSQAGECRQPFYPDASRVFEEIDRLGVDENGIANILGSQAQYDFVRTLPSGGYRLGQPAGARTDLGMGSIARESLGEDYFPYRPGHLHREPPRRLLAQLTNTVSGTLSANNYAGALWLEGSPYAEETIYWLNLMVDTNVPIVACTSPDWAHGTLAASGDRNLVEGVRYIASRIWADEAGSDRVGAVLIDGEQIFTARDVQKSDARAGGFVATGGHGGIVGSMGQPGPPVLTAIPVWRHTRESATCVTQLPVEVRGVHGSLSRPIITAVSVKDGVGDLMPDAIPTVSFLKYGRFSPTSSDASIDSEVEVLARIDKNLSANPLAGFVMEGAAPYGLAAASVDAALRLATYSGMPVVRVGRGNAGGFVPHGRVRPAIAGANLTATKARILLMACLLRFGALPPARDPATPTDAEVRATERALEEFQHVFDTH